MKNAKNELLSILYGESNAKCAEVWTKDEMYSNLRLGYTKKEFDSFVEELNFEYFNGGGTQFLHGTIWLEDGSWYDRVWSFDKFVCVEYWSYKEYPKIPEKLNKQ